MRQIFTLLLCLFFIIPVIAQNKWYVNDLGTNGDIFTSATGANSNPGSAAAPFGTLDYALNQAQAGDTIFVDAGAYTIAGFSINKGITILGTNYSINPNDSDPYLDNPAKNAESVISGGALFMGADNVSLKGLRFTPTGSAITAGGVNRQNITLENNYFDVLLGGGGYIIFRGASINPLVASGLNFVNNRFVKTNGLGVNTLVIADFKNISVRGNSFIETGSSTRTSTAIISNGNAYIDNAVFENNYFRNMNFTFRIFGSNNVSVRKNRIDSSGRGVQFFYGTAPMQHITVDSNIINNDRSTQPILFRRADVNAGLEDINITNNIINQGIDGYTGGGAMIQLEFGNTGINGTVNVLNNKVTISGNYDNALPGANFGVMITGNHHITNIHGNEFTFTAINARRGQTNGIYADIPTGIYFNTDGGSNWGPIPADAEFSIENNIFNGFKNSIGFYDPADAGLTPYTGYGKLTQGTLVNIQHNSFLNDSIAVDNGSDSYDVTANCNWWGVLKVQDMLTRFSTGTVSPLPWLTDGTDTDPGVGFQPMDNTCNGQPPEVTVDKATNVSCKGLNNGSVNITVAGGFAPFTYEWTKTGDATFVSTDKDPSGLAPGVYHLTIKDADGSDLVLDANGDLTSIDVTITEPDAALVATVNATDVSCFNGSNGTAGVIATGGTAPYSYSWSNGSQESSISGLTTGSYIVVVTDANGCTHSATAIINQPLSALSVSLNITNVTCNGGTNGQVTASASGGTGPYTYSINGTDYQPGSSFPNLSANNYTVYVRDNNGCDLVSSAIVTQPSAILISFSGITPSCSNSNTGSVVSNAVGGTGIYVYSWIGPNGFTKASKNISNLAPGNYILTVTDANGCAATSSVTIPAIADISLTAAITDVSCYGSVTGAINITTGGGSGGNFTYSWTGPNGFKAGTEDIVNLKAGSYSVTINDPAGCSLSRTYSIAQPTAALTINAAKTDISNCGGSGTITTTGSGGTAPYMYKLNAGTPQSSGIFSGLATGTYTVAVTDSKGCEKTSTVSIADNGNDAFESNNKQNSASTISVNQSVQARIAPTSTDQDWYKFTTGIAGGSYTITLTHPSVIYSVNLVDSKGKIISASSSSATAKTYNTLAGNTTYSIQVTGALSYSCYSLVVSANSNPAAAGRSAIGGTERQNMLPVMKMQANVYPNPHNGEFRISVLSPEGGNGVVEIVNSLGQVITQKRVSFNKAGNTIINFSNMQQGLLYYRVVLGKEVITGKILGPGGARR